MTMKVGVLALQGAFTEHEDMLSRLGAVPAAEGENPGRLAGVRYLCRTSAFGGDH